MQDIKDEKALIVIDPHGPLAEYVVDSIPRHITERVCYLDPTDTNPIPFNPFKDRSNISLTASNLISAFKGVWHDSWGARLEWFLYCCLAALLEHPSTSLYNAPEMLTNERYRNRIIFKLNDPKIRDFWVSEYPSYNQRYREDAAGPILNKIGQFLANPAIRNVVCKPQKFDLAHAMDNNQIFIVNLNKGRLGEGAANLLGSLIISQIKTAAFKRSNPKPVHIYIDEFQSFGTTAIENILSEGRKYGLRLTIAHQFLDQLDKLSRSAVIGNAGTLVIFRVGAEDARILAPEFNLPDKQFSPSALSNQSPFEAWVKRGVLQQQHTLTTAPPPPTLVRKAKVVAASCRRFGSPLN